jgi:hypothetical protein
MQGVQPPDDFAVRTKAWWAAVLAGQVDEPHPIYGSAICVQWHAGVLRLLGELESKADRSGLVQEAKSWVGRGINGVDASGLTVASKKEEPGILDQTLIAAFSSPEVARFALSYVVDHSRIVPKTQEIVDPKHADRLRRLLPEDFAEDARKALDSGETVVILRVDETAVFRVRDGRRQRHGVSGRDQRLTRLNRDCRQHFILDGTP